MRSGLRQVMPLHHRGLCLAGLVLGASTGWMMPVVGLANGGGAFLVAVIVCAVLLMLPIWGFEIALGSAVQAGMARGLRLTSKTWEWLGWVGGLLAGALAAVFAVAACLAATGLFGRHTQQPDIGGAGVSFFDPVAAVVLLVVWLGIGGCIRAGLVRVQQFALVAACIGLFAGILALVIVPATSPVAYDGLIRLLTPEWPYLLKSRTWLLAIAHAVTLGVAGAGVMVLTSSRLPRDIDVSAAAFQAVGCALVGHFLMASVVVLGLAGDGAAVLGGIAAPGQLERWHGRFVLEGHPLALAALALVCTAGAAILMQVCLGGFWERFAVSVRQAVPTGCLIVCLGGMVLLVGDSPGWVRQVFNGLVLGGLLPLAIVLAAVAVWDGRFTAIHDHVAAHSSIRVAPWWRSLLGSVAPPVVGGALVTGVIDAFLDGGLLDVPLTIGLGLSALIMVAGWYLAARHGTRVFG